MRSIRLFGCALAHGAPAVPRRRSIYWVLYCCVLCGCALWLVSHLPTAFGAAHLEDSAVDNLTSVSNTITATAAVSSTAESSTVKSSAVKSSTVESSAVKSSAVPTGTVPMARIIAAPVPPVHPGVLIDPAARAAAHGETIAPALPEAAPIAPSIPITTLVPTSDTSELSPRWRDTENFLILGTDRRSRNDVWRTDVVMVLGLDRENGRAALLSIPRDLYIEVPNYGWQRINQVDYLGEKILHVEGGGPALVSAVLGETLGVTTQHWVRVDMDGLASLVDALGGVTVHLDCPFYEPIFNLDTNQWEYFTLPAGDVQMDGETAYWFARLRLRESDFGRAKRQRALLWAMRDQLFSTNGLTRLPRLWTELDGLFSTDLTLVQIVDLMRLGLTFDMDNVRANGITQSELQGYRTAQGASVLRIADPARVRVVVDGVWDEAAPMALAYAQDSGTCSPVPSGAPVIPQEVVPAPNAAIEKTAEITATSALSNSQDLTAESADSAPAENGN